MTSNDKAARRSRLLITAGAALGLALGAPAAAQTSAPPAEPGAVPAAPQPADPNFDPRGAPAQGEITVTGSRITSRDFTAPT